MHRTKRIGRNCSTLNKERNRSSEKSPILERDIYILWLMNLLSWYFLKRKHLKQDIIIQKHSRVHTPIYHGALRLTYELEMNFQSVRPNKQEESKQVQKKESEFKKIYSSWKRGLHPLHKESTMRKHMNEDIIIQEQSRFHYSRTK